MLCKPQNEACREVNAKPGATLHSLSIVPCWCAALQFWTCSDAGHIACTPLGGKNKNLLSGLLSVVEAYLPSYRFVRDQHRYNQSSHIVVLQGVDVYLKSDGSGAGRGGAAQKDVMPPLMPGLKARQNKQQ